MVVVYHPQLSSISIISYIMPLFRSKKKKSAQAATLAAQVTAPATYPDNIVRPGLGKLTTGAQQPVNNSHDVAQHARTSPQPVYQTIDASRYEIRLLEVLPGAYPQPIKCVLRPVSLLAATVPQYETVSYCWGQSQRCFPINLNDRRRLIENSAGCVLHRVQLPHQSRLIWIDAVCINQDDDREKGQQVSIMGDIYRCSKQNIVYFGMVNKFARAVQATLQAVLSDMKKNIPKDTTLFELTHLSGPSEQHRMPQNGRLMDPDINLRPLEALYSDPWFGRIWVVQEVALAPTSICYYGDAEFLLADVLRVAVWLIWHQGMRWPHTTISKQGLNRAFSIWYFADHDPSLKSQYQMMTRTLTTICLALETHEATNPKDKIYALLGLHARWKPGLWQAIMPRYDKTVSVSDVYRDATRTMIQEAMSLEILQYRCPRAEHPLLPTTPSWIIDFTRLSGKGIRPRRLGLRFTADDGRGIKECTILAPQGLPVLPLVGFTLDRVKSRTRTIADTESVYVPELADILALSQSLRLPYRDLSQQLARTLVADHDSNGIAPGPRAQEAYSAFLSLCNDSMSLLIKSANSMPSRTKKEQVDLGGRYLQSFLLACVGRCFFVTNGGLMGIGPENLVEGDRVAILYGGRVPFVMSTRGSLGRGEYRLLGECYVDGVMQGQGMRKHKAAGNWDEVFHVV
ncbi:Heterokaryon incompatibility protein 6, OR allele [Fulvia fulva]|nr:Heterokaryon incompatibility protein 6, OR allele [Fulvia fulva]